MFVLAPALAYAFLLKPHASGARRTAEMLAAQRSLLQSEEEAIASMPAVRAEVSAVAETAGRAGTRTYPATDSVGAMTAFGRDVAAALKDAGLVVQRVEMRDSLTRRGGLQELSIDVRAQGDFASILTALRRLEASPRLIHVGRLAIETTGEHQAAGGESLSLVAVIRGYMQ